MDLPIITSIAVDVASVTVRAEEVAVVVAGGAVLAGKDLNAQTWISRRLSRGTKIWQGFQGLSYSILLAGSLVVRSVGHVARVSEDDNRNNYSNQLIWHSSRIYDIWWGTHRCRRQSWRGGLWLSRSYRRRHRKKHPWQFDHPAKQCASVPILVSSSNPMHYIIPESIPSTQSCPWDRRYGSS